MCCIVFTICRYASVIYAVVMCIHVCLSISVTNQHHARTCRFQGGGHGVSRASRPHSTIPESADSRCRPAGTSSTTVIVFTVTSRSVFSSVYRRAALVSCSCFRSLEFSTIGHSVITFFNCFSSPAKDISLSQIIPPHSIVLPYTLSWSQ